MDKALLVVTADHGEQFLEHGGVEHFLWTWQEILHVPLLIHGPGVPAGVRVDAPVSSVDIVPTLLGFAGVPLPRSGLDGRDLRPLWGKDGASAAGPFRERFLYGEASGGLSYASTMPGVYPIYRSVRRGRYKLIEEIPPSGGERKSLYDLESDPDERVDVSTAHPETEAALAAEMKRRYAGAATAKGNAVELKREDRERLRALGYLP